MYRRPVRFVVRSTDYLLEVVRAVRRRLVLTAQLFGFRLEIERLNSVLTKVTIIGLGGVLAFGRATLTNLVLLRIIPQPDIRNAQT